MRKYTLLSFLLTLVLFSCKKPEVVPMQNSTGTPFKVILTSNTDSTVFDVADASTIVTPSSVKEYNVYRVKTVFQNGGNELIFSINDGNLSSSTSFLEKIKAQGNLKVSTFTPEMYSFNVDSLKQLLGGETVKLYINNELLTSGIYAFPSSGIYTCKAIKNIDGQDFTISNDLYVGFINPYGYLDFNYSSMTNQLSAKITNTNLPFSVNWYLDNELIGNANTLATTVSSTSNTAKKLRASVNFDGTTINYEGLLDFNQASEEIEDIKKYGVFFANPANAEDLKVSIKLIKNNETWRVNEGNMSAMQLDKISFYKEIDGKKVYQLTGNISDLILQNTSTGEIKTFNLKINTGIYLPY
jgi:hypothetical protein